MSTSDRDGAAQPPRASELRDPRSRDRGALAPAPSSSALAEIARALARVPATLRGAGAARRRVPPAPASSPPALPRSAPAFAGDRSASRRHQRRRPPIPRRARRPADGGSLPASAHAVAARLRAALRSRVCAPRRAIGALRRRPPAPVAAGGSRIAQPHCLRAQRSARAPTLAAGMRASVGSARR